MRRLSVFCALFVACVPSRLSIETDPPNIAAGPGIEISNSPQEPPEKLSVVKIVFRAPVDYETAQAAIQALELAQLMSPKTILLEIDSPGGEVHAGRALARAIEESPIPVVCVVDGEADSMGYYLLQSCSTRMMTSRSRLLAHKPIFMMPGQSRLGLQELRNLLANLESLNLAMSEHECSRLKAPKECKAKILTGDWWMAAEEALHVGAVDEVVPSVISVLRQLSTP